MAIFFKSLIQWVFCKDKAKGFPNHFYKYNLMSPNELKLYSKTQRTSKKYWEAKFRGCLNQVKQEKLVNQKLETSQQNKKSNSIWVISRLGWNLPYACFATLVYTSFGQDCIEHGKFFVTLGNTIWKAKKWPTWEKNQKNSQIWLV